MQFLSFLKPAVSRRFSLSLAVLSLAIVCAPSARATIVASPGVNLNQIQAQITALQNQVNTLQNTVNTQTTTINNLKTVVGNQAATITALQAKTAPLSVQNGVGTNTELFITGVNVHIVSGSGLTDDGTKGEVPNAQFTGLGNLIIGYNESRSGFGEPDIHTGSHNLVLGIRNNYSSFGGIVSGTFNTMSADYATVLGGDGSVASGIESLVAGGEFDTASGLNSCVIGGIGNMASGLAYSSALGGEQNKSTGFGSTTSGGLGNTASGQFSSVSGGNSVTETTNNGWAAGALHSP